MKPRIIRHNAARPRKFSNRKVVIDGIKFASESEGRRYLMLRGMQERGEIHDLVLQPRFTLLPAFRKNGELFRAIVYVADFTYTTAAGNVIVEDVKGFMGYSTPEFKLKRKMFEAKFQDLYLSIVKMNNKQNDGLSLPSQQPAPVPSQDEPSVSDGERLS